MCQRSTNQMSEYLGFISKLRLPRWCSGKESTYHAGVARDVALALWARKIPWNGKWPPTPIAWKFHGKKSLGSYSPWIEKNWAWLSIWIHIHTYTYTHTSKLNNLFKKIRNTKWIFYEKMSTIKDRNGMDLTEAEGIKKRCQEYTEVLYKMIFMTQIITMIFTSQIITMMWSLT